MCVWVGKTVNEQKVGKHTGETVLKWVSKVERAVKTEAELLSCADSEGRSANCVGNPQTFISLFSCF